MGIAGDVLRRRLRTLSAHVESTSASVAAAAETEVIAYLQRSHGANYSPAAVAALRMPDFGDWAGYFPPVPSCKCGTDGLDVLDFGAGVADSGHVHGDAAVGKWNELRKNMYGMSSQLTQTRDLHIGIDLCAPAGAPVHAFADGEVFLTGVYPDAYDYGHVVVLKHTIDGASVWSLSGHLSAASIAGKVPGAAVSAGDVIGWMGEMHENGNWFPHTHFQLSLLEPVIADMPGVVFEGHRETALRVYPDPRMVLGPLW